MNLKKIPTAELVAELTERQGVQRVDIGLYKGHEVKGKYGESDIEADFVLAIVPGDFCSMPDSLSKQL